VSAPILELHGLAKRYDNGKGVGPIDLALEPGIHGLLGPNGSGKTTLLKTLLGFLAPTAGRASVMGHDVRTSVMNVRRSVGYMAENDVIVPGLNATQTVRLAAELCGIPAGRAHEAAAEALHAVGMGEEAMHDPARLSTGQRQKMKLAAALVHAPALLFLDEPTNGLDPRGRRLMLRVIDEIAREKHISIILSTHILPDVEAVCQDAMVLSGGRLAALEQVKSRQVQRAGAKTWFTVRAMSGMPDFLDACRKRRLEVREAAGVVQVAAVDPKQLFDVANQTGTILLRVVPGTEGVEDTILAHLEAAE
jgi:ABC-2 type transport system ATP-binding protein